jgi:hypothetical protein
MLVVSVKMKFFSATVHHKLKMCRDCGGRGSHTHSVSWQWMEVCGQLHGLATSFPYKSVVSIEYEAG